MPTDRNLDYSLIYVLLGMVVICFLVIAGPLVITPAFDTLKKNNALREFETAFQDVQHPVGTERFALRAEAGDFADSERGCDFFVGEVRRYDGGQEAILTAYESQQVAGNPVQVRFIEAGQMPVQIGQPLPVPLDDLAGWELPSAAAQRSLYLVYLWVAGYEGSLGLDCR
jgi:hypothetical protein